MKSKETPLAITYKITVNMRQDCPPDHNARIVKRYIVEAWSEVWDMPTPLGTAYVAEPIGEGFDPVLEYVSVREDYRRMGVGTALVQACLNSWGDGLVITGSVSEAGEKLYEKFTNETSSTTTQS